MSHHFPWRVYSRCSLIDQRVMIGRITSTIYVPAGRRPSRALGHTEYRQRAMVSPLHPLGEEVIHPQSQNRVA